LFYALEHVIGDAVIASEHKRRDKPQQLLGLRIKRSAFVSQMIECEESFDAKMIGTQDPLVHIRSMLVEFFN
jgi:hypothetical protein